MMPDRKDIRFFPIFIGATMGVLLEVIATLVDEIVVGNLFSDEAFASVNLIEPYIQFEVFAAYLVTVAAPALIMRAHGAGDRKRMGELFSQAILVCGLSGAGLTLIYVLFTPQLVRFVANDPSVYEHALSYDIDNEETARNAAVMLRILAPTAIFICLTRVTAIFYQYTLRIKRTIILFGLAIALLPILFGTLFGQIALYGVAAGVALGPVTAFALMVVFVCVIKKEKLFDYSLMHLE